VREFLEHLLEVLAHQIQTILTDNGIQCAEQPGKRNTAYSHQMRFDMICNGIEHSLPKPNHPSSREDPKMVRVTVFLCGGQVERMN
jgi:hypothetical protein